MINLKISDLSFCQVAAEDIEVRGGGGLSSTAQVSSSGPFSDAQNVSVVNALVGSNALEISSGNVEPVNPGDTVQKINSNGISGLKYASKDGKKQASVFTGGTTTSVSFKIST